jgi:hypothetical protein
MVILMNKPGQLANRLFLFAHFIASAKDHHYKVIAISLDEYAVYFKNFSGSVCPHFPFTFVRKYSKAKSSRRSFYYRVLNKLGRMSLDGKSRFGMLRAGFIATHDDIFDLSRPEIVRQLRKPFCFIRNYFYHDVKRLRKYRNEIAQLFMLSREYAEKVALFAAGMRDGVDIVIGVHIRRGDYKTWRGGQYYFEDDVYTRFIAQAKNLFRGKRIRFLICSNDPVDVSVGGDADCIVGPGSEIEDLYALAECDYLIGPPSSYSRWASFLSYSPLFAIEDPEHVLCLEDFKDVFESPWMTHSTVQPTKAG